MNKRLKYLILSFSLILVIVIGLSCRTDAGDNVTSNQTVLEKRMSEALAHLGAPIPVPAYLPDGFALSDVTEIDNEHSILLTFTNTKNPEMCGEIFLDVFWHPVMAGSLDKAPMKQCTIGDSYGYYQEKEDGGFELYWNLDIRYGLYLSVPEQIPFDAMIKIAESVDYQ
jgi:hypothetical protein